MEATTMIEDEAPPPNEYNEEPPELIVTASDEENARKAVAVYANGIGVDGEIMPPAICDDALALEFSRRYRDDWRYVAEWGRWLEWDGRRWGKESTLKIFDMVRRVYREVDARNPREDGEIRGAKGATIAAIEKILRSAPEHRSTKEIWDSDPWALNTPAGVVDLRTGETNPHDPSLYLSQMTTASPAGDCPRWMRFISEVCGDDIEMEEYLARVAGYCLTGKISEDALFFCYGTGGNGKGCFIDTLSLILGDYFTGLTLEVLLENKFQTHSTDLAGLQGARLVSSSEIDKGRRWNKAKICAMTGGGPITARLMRQDNSTFFPKFKLLISGNNKPIINDVDDAIRRRMHLIPFEIKFPKTNGLRESLVAEKDGILAWAVKGCLDWQAGGLRPPARVVEATQKYLEDEDILGSWIGEECILDPRARTGSSALFASWVSWAEKMKEFVGSQKRLSQALEKRGFRLEHGNTGNRFKGLGLKSEPAQKDLY